MENNASAVFAAVMLLVFLLWVLVVICWLADRSIRWMEIRARDELKGKK